MKYLYLDHNIYIETVNKKELMGILCELKYEFEYLYSSAHIQEAFRVAMNSSSKNKDNVPMLLKNISKLTNNNELVSSESEIIIKKEDPLECYNRAKKFDIRDRIKSDSYTRYKVDREHYKDMLEEDKKNKGISTIKFDKIWEEDVIKNLLTEFNQSMPINISHFNLSEDVRKAAEMGIDYTLPLFYISKGMYKDLKNSHKKLEYTIEILFRLLNYCGYNAEKKESTIISSTHDVTHAIYATKADYLISADQRFVNKCQAVYYYLGVDTKVIYLNQDDIINYFKNKQISRIS